MTRRTPDQPPVRFPRLAQPLSPDGGVPERGKAPRVANDAVEVIESARPDAFSFLLKARATGRLYRVTPTRDPHQPRFWCVMVYRCSPGGLGDPSERPWIGPGGMRREELPDAMEAIRADVGAWLAEAPCLELRRWLLAPAAEPPASGVRTGRGAVAAAAGAAATVRLPARAARRAGASGADGSERSLDAQARS